MVSAFYGSIHSSGYDQENAAVSQPPRRLTASQQDALIAGVQEWYDAGCAVHPAKTDGSKYAIAVQHGSPDLEPDTFPDTYQSGRYAGMPHPRAGQPNPDAGQHRYGWGRIATGDLPRLTPQQIAAEYIRSGRADGIGVFCGLASGGLVMLEAEGRAVALMSAVRDAAVQQGSLDLLERLGQGCVDQSPSGGIHFYLRVIGGPAPGSEVLAARPTDPGQEVLFETRGQGGWSVVAPSSGRTHKSGKPYRFLRGGPATIPAFTPEELERLYAVFRAVDERPAPQPPATQPSVLERKERPDGDILPGDDFNQRASWQEILTGWKPGQVVGDRLHWTRPGKNHGTSATTTADVLCCFSSSAGLPVFDRAGSRNALSKFATYAHLNHAGDFAAAARSLWHQGYGSRHEDDGSGPDGGDQRPPDPRPSPAGRQRSLAEWRQEVADRRAAAIVRPGLYLDRSPTGSGKTHATIQAIHQLATSVTALPTHANVIEHAAAMQRAGIDAVPSPQLSPDNCQNYGEASEAQRLGLVAGATVCQSCDFKTGCPYRMAAKAAAKAPHRVVTHELLRRSNRATKGAQAVIIDESPESVLAPTLTVQVKEITPVESLAHAIQNHFYITATGQQKSFAAAMQAVVAAIHEACSTVTDAGVVTVDLGRFGQDVPRDWQRLLYQAIRQVGVSDRLTAEAMTIVTKAAAGELESLTVVTDRTPKNLYHYVTGSWRPTIPAGAAVIGLDATGNAADIEAATGTPVIDCTPDGHLATVHPVVQIVDDISRRASTKNVAGVVEAFLALHPGVRLGIIGHQPHIKALMAGEELGSAARQRIVKSCYFGQGPDRASNEWHQECDHVLVLGTPRANPGDYRRWLVQHGLHDAARRRDGDWGPRPWSSVTVDGKPITVDGVGYRDADWQRAFVAVSRANLDQSVGRGRSILPEGVPVTIVSSEPTQYPVAPALDVEPAALRATVEAVRGLLEPGGVSLLSPIESPYREKYGNGAVPTRAIVGAVVAATRTADKPAGVGRSAVEKRLRQCLAAGMLAQPKRGWWALPGSPAIPPEALTQPARQVEPPPPAVITPLAPSVVIETGPSAPPLPDDIQVVTVPTMPDIPEIAPLVPQDDLLEQIEERAAILEYDAGRDRETADRLAREMLLGRDAPQVQAVQLTAGVDHQPLVARSHPAVRAVLARFPGTASVVTDRTDPFAGRRSQRRAPGTCVCGCADWVQVPIHGGRSTRVDCRNCDRFGWFAVWHGSRLKGTPGEETPPAGQPAAPVPDTLSFGFLPAADALPTGPPYVAAAG